LLGRRFWELPVVEASGDLDRLRAGMAQREELHDVPLSIDLGGRVTRWRLSGRPTFDPSGAFTGYRGSMLDETPLEDARRDAASRLEQFRTFIDALPVAVLSWDANERVQWMNLEAQRLCGLDQLSVVGAGVAELADRVGLEPVTDPEAGGDPSLEPELFEMLCVDGVRRSFLHRPLAYDDGAGPRTASLFLDVTASRERARLLERMGRMHAIGRFAGSIAHDLGNSMTVFEGLLACLEHGDADGVLEATDDLRDTLTEVRSMIDRLRGLSQGGRSGEEEPVRISDPVQRIARLRDRFGAARVEYVDDGGGRLVAELDRVDLERAVTNLVRNAEEATSEIVGGGVVHLRLERAGDGFAALHVEDDGPGIPADERARILEPLVSSKSRPGSGLGLAQVNALAVRTGGSVEIAESSLGGARVTLRVPAVDEPDPGRADASGAERSEAPASERHAPVDDSAPQVLLVDDNRAVRRTLARALGRRGWIVAQAESGDEARDRIEGGQTPALVITDVTMPGTLDGVALARWLSATHPEIPVIVMSAYASADQVPGCLFLEKPVTDATLDEAARSVMAPA
jgi:CheY-like chemotaxis protein